MFTTHFVVATAPKGWWQITSVLGRGRKKNKRHMVNTGICFGWFSCTGFTLEIFLNDNQVINSAVAVTFRE